MTCMNISFSSFIFVTDLPSYGLIGLISIGLILYLSYIITYIRNSHTTNTIYIYISQISLLFILLSSITFLFRSNLLTNFLCLIQTLSLQIFPFFLLLNYNIHYIYQWLLKTTQLSNRRRYLILLSSFLIYLLIILIQMGILLLWFFNHQEIFNQCITTECSRPLFLCSLSLNFLLLFLLAFQTSIKYHLYNNKNNFIYLLISLLSICVTIIWICLYLFIPLKLSLRFYINNNSILAYGNIFFVYTFLGPLLFEELFYQENIRNKNHIHKSNKMTFKCLSLTKEQQRAFMAAYIKRNLTASCENLTTITISSPISINRQTNQQQLSQTCHSTLSVDSLCPTLASTVSHDLPSKNGTMTSEYLLLSPSINNNNNNNNDIK